MAHINIKTGSGKFENILCLGAHCDDIEIGCGGALLAILEENPEIIVSWVVFTSNKKRRLEAEAAAKLFTKNARSVNLLIFDFEDGYLPYSGLEVKKSIEKIKSQIPNPDLIFTHYRHDLHQDHRFISELTGNTFRNHFTLEYEIPKWDGDLGCPNTFIQLSEKNGREKISFLQKCYNSQKNKKWFTDDLFWSLMRLRGVECNAFENIAEAFYARKSSLEFSSQ